MSACMLTFEYLQSNLFHFISFMSNFQVEVEEYDDKLNLPKAMNSMWKELTDSGNYQSPGGQNKISQLGNIFAKRFLSELWLKR